MIDRSISVHLQDFPDVDFIKDETQLIHDMDLVRGVCSVALSIRDHLNLRVRLPLQSLTIIGKNAERFLFFKEIIADEVNVKEIKISDQIDQYGELKLQVNFKKIGAKYGAKVKEITNAIKENNWQKIDERTIKIADIELYDDEFSLKLTAKNIDEKKFILNPLPSNDYVVMLDIEVTKELEDEGIARDIVRAIQQHRKDCNLDISAHIDVKIFSPIGKIRDVVNNFKDYIKLQVLAHNIELSAQELSPASSETLTNASIDDGALQICHTIAKN